MTKAIYLDDSYLREFDAVVESVAEDKFVVLNETAFYPSSGGQPHDTGKMIRKDGEEFLVVFAGKFGGNISHEVSEPGLKKGDEVHCIIDWDRRYKLMRMHTSAHVVCAIFHDYLGAMITGNQKGVEKTRVDLSLEDFDREKIEEMIAKANEAMAQNIDVEVSYLPKEEAMKIPGIVKLANKMPPDLKTLRIVKIGDIDCQADGGTHVKNTKEVGKIKLLKMENKGKINRRVYYCLED